MHEDLLSILSKDIEELEDSRSHSNALKYNLADIVFGAFSVFYMQDPSFLANQRRLLKGCGENNFKSFFHRENIPSANQIRNILDNVNPTSFYKTINRSVELLDSNGILEKFKFYDGGYLIALDGTQYYRSENIHCQNCSTKETKDGLISYHHNMLCASIVSGDIKEVIPLNCEFIVPQDGSEKQDCENAAIKRWLKLNEHVYRKYKPTIVGDDLLSNHVVCSAILEQNYHFILVCKEPSHKTLYEYINGANLEKHEVSKKKIYKKYIYYFKYINQVPIRDGDDALLVNWLEIKEVEKSTGKVTYHNNFISDRTITKDNVYLLASGGRAKWRIENENNNTLKTKGYRFTHNYGHGKNYLSSVFATLIIIAFLFHTIMWLGCKFYQAARNNFGARMYFFHMIRSLSQMFIFNSWEHLMILIGAPPNTMRYASDIIVSK
jgi:hypothetical protein